MDQAIIDNYLKAGKITATAREFGQQLIKPGASVREILEKVEAKILELGGQPAFPAQISLNEFAAHCCSDFNDTAILQDQVVKLDVGVHIDGYIADTAVTVDLSEKHGKLLKASQDALENALALVRPGVTLGAIGKAIQETITAAGFSPVRNLSGHGLGLFEIHARPSIPNIDNGNQNVLKEGMVIAIEPFASTGAGVVQESSPATIFSLVNEAGIRDPITRNVLAEIKTYQGLPFAKRWLEKKFGIAKTNFALRQLLTKGCLEQHPPLVDEARGLVSQAEHSVIVLEKPIVFTRV
ncbi:type II methionyl aminopeptidase [Candidatus Woesearchaeota archaeon]|nr:type II methionyl aminopeptidase [Candidatus Woesearchaeota archaeon]